MRVEYKALNAPNRFSVGVTGWEVPDYNIRLSIAPLMAVSARSAGVLLLGLTCRTPDLFLCTGRRAMDVIMCWSWGSV